MIYTHYDIVFDTRGNTAQKECARSWYQDDHITELFYGGAKGGAKSFTGVSLIFGDALFYPGTHYFIARKKLNDLRKFTRPSIHEVFDLWNVTQNEYNYNGADNFYQMHNGSRVYLLEAKYYPSDPLYERFGSIQMTRGWIEEIGDFEANAKANLGATVGRWKNGEYNLAAKLFMTGNPTKNFMYPEFYRKDKEGKLESYKKFIKALPTDNKMLPPGYIEQLHRILSPAQKERLIYGNWEYDDDPSAWIDYDSIQDYFKNSHVEEGLKYITADIARKGKDSTVIRAWSGRRVIERISIPITKVTESAQAIRELQSKYKVPASKTVVDEDGVGGGVVDILSCKGFINNSKPIVKKGVTSNYENLKTQCSHLTAQRIVGGELYENVTDGDIKQRITEEMEQVKQKDIESDGKIRMVPKKIIQEKIGRSPDDWDCIMMREYFDLIPKYGLVF